MRATGVDVLISAPQKGWSASPAAGLVMLSDRAAERLANTDSDSFALDLKKWRAIMQAYLDGGHAYHATMPTDACWACATRWRRPARWGSPPRATRNGALAGRSATNCPRAASARRG